MRSRSTDEKGRERGVSLKDENLGDENDGGLILARRNNCDFNVLSTKTTIFDLATEVFASQHIFAFVQREKNGTAVLCDAAQLHDGVAHTL